ASLPAASLCGCFTSPSGGGAVGDLAIGRSRLHRPARMDCAGHLLLSARAAVDARRARRSRADRRDHRPDPGAPAPARVRDGPGAFVLVLAAWLAIPPPTIATGSPTLPRCPSHSCQGNPHTI